MPLVCHFTSPAVGRQQPWPPHIGERGLDQIHRGGLDNACQQLPLCGRLVRPAGFTVRCLNFPKMANFSQDGHLLSVAILVTILGNFVTILGIILLVLGRIPYPRSSV